MVPRQGGKNKSIETISKEAQALDKLDKDFEPAI